MIVIMPTKKTYSNAEIEDKIAAMEPRLKSLYLQLKEKAEIVYPLEQQDKVDLMAFEKQQSSDKSAFQSTQTDKMLAFQRQQSSDLNAFALKQNQSLFKFKVKQNKNPATLKPKTDLLKAEKAYKSILTAKQNLQEVLVTNKFRENGVPPLTISNMLSRRFEYHNKSMFDENSDAEKVNDMYAVYDLIPEASQSIAKILEGLITDLESNITTQLYDEDASYNDEVEVSKEFSEHVKNFFITAKPGEKLFFRVTRGRNMINKVKNVRWRKAPEITLVEDDVDDDTSSIDSEDDPYNDWPDKPDFIMRVSNAPVAGGSTKHRRLNKK